MSKREPCIKIIVGSSTSEDDTNSQINSGSNATSDQDEMPDAEDVNDTATTFVLNPVDISKNIDLMKTVAMLMENKLQQRPKGTDREKLWDLQSDVQRFPEAYQKFTSIIHQIQYLNITTEWDISCDGCSTLTETKSFLPKVLQPKTRNSPQDLRKTVMFNLLSELQLVFNRYNKIQILLEDRFNKLNQLLVKKVLQNSTETRTPITSVIDSEEDDPYRPLLSKEISSSQASFGSVEKLETLAEVLRKTRRHAVDVQDSIEVLHDLISWDYKQAISSMSVDESIFASNGNYHTHSNDSQVTEIEVESPHDHCVEFERSHRSITTILSIGILFLTLLVVAAALLFLRFNY